MQSPTDSNVSAPDSLRVLVVDDHPDLLSMLDLMMQRRQYAVRTALSASEALQLASDFAPHVIVSDIGMPGMDGYEMMEALRGQPQFGPLSLHRPDRLRSQIRRRPRQTSGLRRPSRQADRVRPII